MQHYRPTLPPDTPTLGHWPTTAPAEVYPCACSCESSRAFVLPGPTWAVNTWPCRPTTATCSTICTQLFDYPPTILVGTNIGYGRAAFGARLQSTYLAKAAQEGGAMASDQHWYTCTCGCCCYRVQQDMGCKGLIWSILMSALRGVRLPQI
jgi:hypothetical protein